MFAKCMTPACKCALAKLQNVHTSSQKSYQPFTSQNEKYVTKKVYRLHRKGVESGVSHLWQLLEIIPKESEKIIQSITFNFLCIPVMKNPKRSKGRNRTYVSTPSILLNLSRLFPGSMVRPVFNGSCTYRLISVFLPTRIEQFNVIVLTPTEKLPHTCTYKIISFNYGNTLVTSFVLHCYPYSRILFVFSSQYLMFTYSRVHFSSCQELITFDGN